MEWYLAVMNKYADFSGRARRKEYWMFSLIYGIGYIALAIATAIVPESLKTVAVIVLALVVLGHLLPGIAVSVRRLHDTGRSAWWLLIALVPVASIALLVFMCLDSDFGANEYGPNPKELAFAT